MGNTQVLIGCSLPIFGIWSTRTKNGSLVLWKNKSDLWCFHVSCDKIFMHNLTNMVLGVAAGFTSEWRRVSSEKHPFHTFNRERFIVENLILLEMESSSFELWTEEQHETRSLWPSKFDYLDPIQKASLEENAPQRFVYAAEHHHFWETKVSS